MTNNPIIKNIEIGKYRRFKNFRGTIPDFKQFNLLYGWNYSGKTTLSRIFAFYDGTTEHLNIDKDANFCLKTIFGDLDTTKTNNIKVYTFNADYIKNNLFFEKNLTSNIIVVSDKANDIVENIKQLKLSRQKLLEKLNDWNNQHADYEKEYNAIRSEYALKIDEIFIEKFTARNIQSVEKELDINNLDIYLLNHDTKEAKINTLKNPSSFNQISKIEKVPLLDIEEIINKLEKTVTPSLAMQKLQKMSAVDWVKNGIAINRNSQVCLFCGAPLQDEYLDSLDEIFKSEFDELGNILLEYNKSLNIYCNTIPSPAIIINNYRKDYEELHKLFNEEIIKYNNKINALKKILRAKYNNRSIKFQSKISLNIEKINRIIDDLNNNIESHNLFLANEITEKEKLKKELKNCIIAELLSDSRYINSIKSLKESMVGIEDVNKQLSSINEQIFLEETKISDVKKGVEEINKILKRLFIGSENVFLKVEQSQNDEGKLVDITKLYRADGCIAENLSDGERTAIAFAHFYVKILDAIKCKTSKNEVLFIDDPISSLDKNHIYSVSVMIQEVIDKFNQTFVTTHNYELYRLLKRKANNVTNYYYIKRLGEISTIEELPKELKEFDSEYEYFFKQLYEFNLNNANSDIYLIGHCARRFLDNYLQYKIPNNMNPADKLTRFINEIQEDLTKYNILYRIVNDESHVHPEILFDKSYLVGAVKLLLDTMEQYDKLHYETLIKSCNL